MEALAFPKSSQHPQKNIFEKDPQKRNHRDKRVLRSPDSQKPPSPSIPFKISQPTNNPRRADSPDTVSSLCQNPITIPNPCSTPCEKPPPLPAVAAAFSSCQLGAKKKGRTSSLNRSGALLLLLPRISLTQLAGSSIARSEGREDVCLCVYAPRMLYGIHKGFAL